MSQCAAFFLMWAIWWPQVSLQSNHVPRYLYLGQMGIPLISLLLGVHLMVWGPFLLFPVFKLNSSFSLSIKGDFSGFSCRKNHKTQGCKISPVFGFLQFLGPKNRTKNLKASVLGFIERLVQFSVFNKKLMSFHSFCHSTPVFSFFFEVKFLISFIPPSFAF